MKKNKMVLFVLITGALVFSVTGQEYHREYSLSEYPVLKNEIVAAINEYYEEGDSENWKKGRSSVLIEKNKPADFYEWKNLFDGDLSTAWVEGAKGNGVGEYVLIRVPEKLDHIFVRFTYGKQKQIRASLKLNNGFCQNESLFYKNNRVKKAELVVYDTPLVVGQNRTYVKAEPVIIYKDVIELKDTMEEQIFEFPIKLREGYKYYSPEVTLKFTIIDVYPGSTYNDTCISEMQVYGEYIDEDQGE